MSDRVIRSRRDFLRCYMPRRYREEFIVSKPPARCSRCSNIFSWRRSWKAWRCDACGWTVWDDDRMETSR